MLASQLTTAVAAAAASPDVDFFSVVKDFGLPLVFVALFAFGYIVPKSILEKAERERDRERDERLAMARTMEEKVIPTLIQAQEAVRRQAEASEAVLRRQAGGD